LRDHFPRHNGKAKREQKKGTEQPHGSSLLECGEPGKIADFSKIPKRSEGSLFYKYEPKGYQTNAT
jgi:hypothetical protein